ncbi:MAG: DUF547 domain-containing protein [Bacteroidota bacterium]
MLKCSLSYRSPKKAIINSTKYFLIIAFSSYVFLSCSRLNPENPGSTPVNHAAWNTLLKKHVDNQGLVDYQGFMQDRAALKDYLLNLTNNAPNTKNWTSDDRLAYWINLYNAFTIDLVLTHYPVESIKDIGPAVQIPLVNTPWQIEMIDIGEEKYNLDNVEHNIIRKNFEEPRIHFALVCAAMSCPKLRQEAYTGSRLEEQLADQAQQFLKDTSKNQISPEEIKISKLFMWYKGDFTDDMSLIAFLNQYTEVVISDDADISHMNYNWKLNEQPK